MATTSPTNGAASDPPKAAAVPTAYKIIRVPRASSRLADLVTKVRATRLCALKTDPTAFLAQHAVEEALPMDAWHARLTNPQVTVLACVAAVSPPTPGSETVAAAAEEEQGEAEYADLDSALGSETDVNLLLEGEWLAVAALRGPMAYEDYYVTPDMGLPVPEHPEAEARWHVYDLYTVPSQRGQGLARSLVEACISTAVGFSKALKQEHTVACGRAEDAVRKVRVRLFMNPKFAWLVRMYESVGFAVAGKITLIEGFRANYMDESIPAGTDETPEGRAKWHTRFGLAMERVVDLA
ncbi:hypothetical protein N0V87_004630 [Didymella glomerata]|uniref:N-acetyltransferase domain-containing protein n=1 Tax=Didymella glomerata TaxID=749621 RepID=A0A9W8X051_9PLEO|nr:hypothetical protein N0V87_004630 [Didymella glomerata]